MKYQILNDRAVIHINGKDAKSFLQKLITNNAENHYCFSYMLNSRGRFLFDFFLYNNNNEFYLDIQNSQTSEFIKKISLYKLRADITVQEVTSQYNILYSSAPITSDYALYCMQDPRFNQLGFRSLCNTGMQFEEIGDSVQDFYFEHKYRYAIPDGVNDLEYERSIPVEYGGIELKALDFHKGCYIGQEVIARANYHGVIRKKIFKVEFDEVLEFSIQNNHEIVQADDPSVKVGRLCSYYGKKGIALINEEKILSLEGYMVANTPIKLTKPIWRS